jgi:hypothetical protein
MNSRGKAKRYGCFITLMEVLYRVWRDEGQAAGQLAYQQCQALPRPGLPRAHQSKVLRCSSR